MHCAPEVEVLVLLPCTRSARPAVSGSGYDNLRCLGILKARQSNTRGNIPPMTSSNRPHPNPSRTRHSHPSRSHSLCGSTL